MLHKLATIQKFANSGPRRVVARISDESVDREGDIVVQAGLDTRNFVKTGGTVLWQHDPSTPIAKCVSLKREGAATLATVLFPDVGVSAKSDEIYGLIKQGVCNATSIGFRAMKFEPVDSKDPYGGRKYLSTELCEFSFVSVPANVNATIIERSAKYGRTREVATLGALDRANVGVGAPADTRGLGGAHLAALVREEELERLRKTWSL